ncbi:kinase-like domain-containing protein [Rhodocollybia butyracea]|uniref:non-specific serine/threonine protein kinase n=1 Tax=Rhodocollybia butyracea TaxID=206335 RepID=A0A9P5PEK9_9AGAR|nr:kinase-like domain-containing protein [Rhodocollybia butyracea]
MFVKGHFFEVENFKLYRPGGFHPVHLGDTFHNDRYTVVHKLGYGSYSTVWLVKDSVTNRFAALKIIVSESTNIASEMAVFRHLQQSSNLDIDNGDKDYVVHLLDEFEHHGPNGMHQCIVTEALGPSVYLDDAELMDHFAAGFIPTNISKRIVAQVSRGIRYLHKHRVVHGDLYPHNILLYTDSLSSRSSQEDIEGFLGKPQKMTFQTCDTATNPSDSLDPHAPQYLVRKPDSMSLRHHCFSNRTSLHVKISDFGEAFIWSPEDPEIHDSHCARVFAAPELLFENSASFASDIWALGVIVYHFLCGGSIFPFQHNLVFDMIRKLGPIPSRWYEEWDDRSLLDPPGSEAWKEVLRAAQFHSPSYSQVTHE